jgi:signal peptidase I
MPVREATAKASTLVWGTLTLLLAVSACGILLVSTLRKEEWLFASTQGTSMVPTLHPGDLVVSRPADPADLHVGDLVVFQHGRKLVVHRLVSIEPAGKGVADENGRQRWLLVTRGAALKTNDPPVPGEAIAGRVALALPWAGWLVENTSAMGNWFALLFLAWSLATALKIRHWWRFPGAGDAVPEVLRRGQL